MVRFRLEALVADLDIAAGLRWGRKMLWRELLESCLDNWMVGSLDTRWELV